LLGDGLSLPEGYDEQDRAEKKSTELEQQRIRISTELIRLDNAVTEIAAKIERLAELQAAADSLGRERSLYEQLATALRADRFIAYLLETAYDDLCSRGSAYLLRLSQERYTFKADKNGFRVVDGWNSDADRPASSLSGGESFLASLALALALADSVSSLGAEGGIGTRLEALFLDEGVSSLDQDDTLPTVIDALMALQNGDRLIGVISHMDNLAERLPVRIEVVKSKGGSTIRTSGAVMASTA
jgi:exonuclease SbcC